MIQVADLPHLIAALNGVSVIAIGAGFLFIRAGDRRRHRACMIAALAASAVFLVVYLIYKANSGFAKFGGEGAIRTVYFTILALHVIGAIAIVPMVPVTLWRALKGDFARHRKLARWTFPLWFYVGVSGVVVYLMAIHLYPYRG